MVNVAPGGLGASLWWVFAVGTQAPASGGQPVGSVSSPLYVQAATEAAAEAATGKGNTTPPVGGPFPTKAAAQAWVAGAGAQYFGTGKTNVAPPNDTPVTGGTPGLGSGLSFQLGVSGIAAWFFRGLKVLIGGVLILVGVSHLTGLSNKLTQVAGKVAPIAAVAA